MRRSSSVTAQIAAVAISGFGLAAIAGAGTAQAAPQDCAVSKGLFDASAVCQPDGGSNYVLHLDCVGFYASGPFPLYSIGQYKVLSYPFTPSGQRTTAACTGMGPGVVAIATNAFVEIYNP
ncbi:hypothetical protein ACIP5Y_37125 [Nocardia sp. NPDC088792]|uniref:hypothetical protein n=1 Tax=Nocardia sp. NPDC088792 TaxID=3364332 RepID=UPI0038108F57